MRVIYILRNGVLLRILEVVAKFEVQKMGLFYMDRSPSCKKGPFSQSVNIFAESAKIPGA